MRFYIEKFDGEFIGKIENRKILIIVGYIFRKYLMKNEDSKILTIIRYFVFDEKLR